MGFMISDQRKHLPVLTGLRFIAAFSVLLAHSLHALFRQESSSPFLHQFALQLAYLGLTLFFVLSGCVLTLNYADSFVKQPMKTLRRFWASRFARLYPLYIFFIFVFFAFAPNAILILKNIFPWHLLLVQTWTFSWVDHATPRALYFYPYAWSISSEMFLYLLLPFITWVLWKYKSFKLDILLFSVLYLATIIMLFKVYRQVMVKGNMTWHGIAVVSPVQFLQWIAYYSPFTHVSAFFAGCIVGKHLLFQKSSKFDTLGKIWVWISLGIYITILVFVTPPDSQHPLKVWDLPKHGMLYAPFIASLVLVLSKYQNYITKFLSCGFCQLFGETSYSIYLLHPLVAGLFAMNASNSISDPGQWIKLLVIISFTLIISYGTYSLIEVPSRRWLRNALSES